MLLLQAIIHPDTGEKILMPFRMSGTVTRCGSFGGSGIEGLVMWSNIEVSFTLGTVMARQGSSGCLEKVTLSWALIKTSLPQWQRCSRGLRRRKHRFFWSILKAPFFFGDFEVLAREELGQRKRYQILPNIPILTFFDRLYPIWYTSGKTFCFVFFTSISVMQSQSSFVLIIYLQSFSQGFCLCAGCWPPSPKSNIGVNYLLAGKYLLFDL